MHRVARVVGSFAIVLVAYWAYALVAVPLIEPTAPRHQGESISDAERDSTGGRLNADLAELVALFPRGSWELDNPKILESEQYKLLMRDYENMGDGRVKIRPCTIILTPDGPAETEAQRRREAIVLQSPEGALLEFDAPFDLRQMAIGRLVGGRLLGRITIRSAGKQPGAEDDLRVTTRDVQLTEQNIITPHAVDFRFGPHTGRGGQMRMKLLAAEKPSGGASAAPSFGGIELFELRHVERLHLELGQLDLADIASDATVPSTQPAGNPGVNVGLPGNGGLATAPPKPAEALPVEVTCQGPFRFDMVGKVATFEDQVNVLRLNPSGPSDQLTCELLSIFFTDKGPAVAGAPTGAADAASGGPAETPHLRPSRLEARGDPVVVLAPSQAVHARGQRLQYDLDTRRVVLDGSREVMLQRAADEIRARSLEYQPAEEKGRLGQIAAQGPGWLRGRMDPSGDQQLEARWNDRLQVRPSDGNQVISLTGGAGLTFRGMEQLNANEIHFWLLESKPAVAGESWALTPERMLARGEVALQSRSLSGVVEQMEVWFDPVLATGRGVASSPPVSPSAASAGPNGVPTATPAATLLAGPAPLSSSARGDVASAPAVSAGAPAASAPNARQQHMRITGRLLRAQMRLEADGRAELSEVIVEDNVEFVETQTRQPDEKPLLVRGDRVHVVDADQPHMAVVVSGRPAHFVGRGLALSGKAINLNRGTNRLWIDEPGQMDIEVDRDLDGQPLASPTTMQIRWQHGMAFDGRVARFEESVTATAPQRLLQTETLEVQLERAIDFSAAKTTQNPKIEQLRCLGGVFMESVSFDGETQLSLERMQMDELTIQPDSGTISGTGPGWLTSVRRRAGNATERRGGGLFGQVSFGGPETVGAGGAPSYDATRPLDGMHARFQGTLSGNMLPGRRELIFHDGVQTAYAPVENWAAVLDVDDPASLGPRGMVLTCGRLRVYEMPTAEPDVRGVEMVADGNPVVEGATFTAWAIRMSYAEAKDLLILEGDGRTDARLFYQPQIGGATSKHTARKIFYSPQTNRLRVEGARSLEVDQ